MNEATEVRDGFVIRDYAGNEISFVECRDNNQGQRELCLRGILRNMRDGLIVFDTRDGEERET